MSDRRALVARLRAEQARWQLLLDRGVDEGEDGPIHEAIRLNEEAANALETMEQKIMKFRYALTSITEVDPGVHSAFGTARCFILAQDYANAALEGELNE